MTVHLVISLPKIPYIHRIYTALANPNHIHLKHASYIISYIIYTLSLHTLALRGHGVRSALYTSHVQAAWPYALPLDLANALYYILQLMHTLTHTHTHSRTHTTHAPTPTPTPTTQPPTHPHTHTHKNTSTHKLLCLADALCRILQPKHTHTHSHAHTNAPPTPHTHKRTHRLLCLADALCRIFQPKHTHIQTHIHTHAHTNTTRLLC